jgi:hypothetical protein
MKKLDDAISKDTLQHKRFKKTSIKKNTMNVVRLSSCQPHTTSQIQIKLCNSIYNVNIKS